MGRHDKFLKEIAELRKAKERKPVIKELEAIIEIREQRENK